MPTIMIVEDDETIARMLQQVMDIEGMRAVTVSDPEQVKRVACRERPDAVLVDLMLPGQSGIEVAADLRESGFTSTPIVAITASSFLAETALEADVFNAVVEKPFDIDDLLVTLAETLPAGQAASG